MTFGGRRFKAISGSTWARAGAATANSAASVKQRGCGANVLNEYAESSDDHPAGGDAHVHGRERLARQLNRGLARALVEFFLTALAIRPRSISVLSVLATVTSTARCVPFGPIACA